MTNWGWYWKVKKKYKPKALCSWLCFCEIDSFSLFKNKTAIRFIKESKDRTILTIPDHHLIATLQDDNALNVVYKNGSYTILVEQKTCYFGGFYYFFHCPRCNARMRKLYCLDGKYLCRTCAHLGYYSQRLRPCERLDYMKYKIMGYLRDRAGSLSQKPPWMKKDTFQRLRRKFVRYDEESFYASHEELRAWYGTKTDGLLNDPYFLLVPSDLQDAYVERISRPMD